MSKIKAVIDTNLMISSAIAREGLTYSLKNMWVDQEFKIVTSAKILEELERVLCYQRISKYLSPDEIQEYIAVVKENALFTKGKYSVDKIRDDPSDNIFLSAAMEGNADYIVSRDPHLRNLKQYQGIKIVSLTNFIQIVKKNK